MWLGRVTFAGDDAFDCGRGEFIPTGMFYLPERNISNTTDTKQTIRVRDMRDDRFLADKDRCVYGSQQISKLVEEDSQAMPQHFQRSDGQVQLLENGYFALGCVIMEHSQTGAMIGKVADLHVKIPVDVRNGFFTTSFLSHIATSNAMLEDVFAPGFKFASTIELRQFVRRHPFARQLLRLFNLYRIGTVDFDQIYDTEMHRIDGGGLV